MILFKTNDTLELTEFKEEFDFRVIHRMESWRSQSKAAQRQHVFLSRVRPCGLLPNEWIYKLSNILALLADRLHKARLT